MSWIKDTLETVHQNSNAKRKQRQFGGLIIAFLLLLFFVSVYKEGLILNSKQLYTAIGSVILLIVVFLIPVVFYPFLFIWLFIGNILGEISSFIILGIVYYLLLSPITLLLKITNKKKVITGWVDKKESIDYEKLY
ncbi:SxtJ family membrane protein [uncultured Aquimarina sp.]|uniref:SxtJ family membrane protein n=1 Tax=uncultured Aquimarina sp. TaxID=575652 RepID=UPI00260F259F|nr:SxtJ family membrane protein [uncultured Aquimarina sp.]